MTSCCLCQRTESTKRETRRLGDQIQATEISVALSILGTSAELAEVACTDPSPALAGGYAGDCRRWESQVWVLEETKANRPI